MASANFTDWAGVVIASVAAATAIVALVRTHKVEKAQEKEKKESEQRRESEGRRDAVNAILVRQVSSRVHDIEHHIDRRRVRSSVIQWRTLCERQVLVLKPESREGSVVLKIIEEANKFLTVLEAPSEEFELMGKMWQWQERTNELCSQLGFLER